MKIVKIERRHFKGDVYNLELNSSRQEDDLFWVEGKSETVTHNCFPKDLSAMLYISDSLRLSVPTLAGAQITNQLVRKDRDWEKMEGRAVSKRSEDKISLTDLDNVVLLDSPTFRLNLEDPMQISYEELDGHWKPIQCETFEHPLSAPLENEILYMFSEKVGYYLSLQEAGEDDSYKFMVNQQFED